MIIEVVFALLVALLGIAALLGNYWQNISLSNRLKADSTENYECQIINRRNPYLLKRCRIGNKEQSYLDFEKNQSGFGIIEAMTAIALGTVLIAILSKSHALIAFNSKIINSLIERELVISRVESEWRRMIRAYDSHPLMISPRVHSDGQITFKNGSLNPVMYGNIKFRPSPQSDAITVTRAEISQLADIISCTANDYQRTGRACLRYQENARTSDFRSFLLISVDGLYEATGSLSGSAKCKDFSLLLARGMLLDDPVPQTNCNEMTIVPLNYTQTIYQSTNGDFRLISHRNSENVENQPITKPALKLKFSLSLLNTAQPWMFGITVSANDRKILDKSHTAAFTKIPAENLMLNII